MNWIKNIRGNREHRLADLTERFEIAESLVRSIDYFWNTFEGTEAKLIYVRNLSEAPEGQYKISAAIEIESEIGFGSYS